MTTLEIKQPQGEAGKDSRAASTTQTVTTQANSTPVTTTGTWPPLPSPGAGSVVVDTTPDKLNAGR